jgi:hypothetical protein
MVYLKRSIHCCLLLYACVRQTFSGPLITSYTANFACGPGSSVGIATGYGLDGPGIESRWGAGFSAPLHTGPGAHLDSCTMGLSRG